MNLPLMSPAELDAAVYKLVARELGISNAMRFIARHSRPDGADYTQERLNWLPQDPAEVDTLFKAPNTGFDALVSRTRRKTRGVRVKRKAETPRRKRT